MSWAAADRPVIRTQPVPRCAVCGNAGVPLYDDLEDRLYGAPGQWRMVRCEDPACGLLWLDPAPVPEDLGLAYADYYTHGSAAVSRGPIHSRLKRWAMEGYYAGRYGYRVPGRAAKRLLAALAIRSPELREHFDRLILMQPPPREGGRALDVGCGEGRTVEALAALGWRAEGVDFDARAVEAARARGLDVRLGTVADQRYPDSSFDAIGMTHVIEHVPDPVATLSECRRVLRPGGQIVLATPNALSLGHRRFGRDWRGLETPRHLHVFTPPALRQVAARAGLTEVSLRASTLGAAFANAESRRIRGESGARLDDAGARAFAAEESVLRASDPWAGEELLIVATRDE